MTRTFGIAAFVIAGLLAQSAWGQGTRPAPATKPATMPMTGQGATSTFKLMDPAQIVKLPAGRALAEAVKYFAAGDDGGAQSILEDLQKKYPKDQPIVFANAVLMRARWGIREAQAQFAEVVALDADSPAGQCAAQMMKIDQKQDEASFGALMQLTKAPNADPMILWAGGIAGRQLDKNEEGVACYRALLKQWNPGPGLVHQTFANELDELRQYDESLVHRRLAVKLDPDGWSYQGLANTLFALRQFNDAADAYVQAIKLAPKATYWFDYANMLVQTGQLDGAIDTCQKGLAQVPNNARGLDLWGQALGLKKMPMEALEKFKAAIAADGAYDAAYTHAALASLRVGDKEQAMAFSKEAAEKHPSAETYRGLGIMYTQVGNYSEAAAALGKAAGYAPKNADIIAEYADMLTYAGKLDDAMVQAKAATELDTKSGHGWMAQAHVLLSQHKGDEGVALLRQALTVVTSGQQSIYEQLAAVYEHDGKTAEAAEARKKAEEFKSKAGDGK